MTQMNNICIPEEFRGDPNSGRIFRALSEFFGAVADSVCASPETVKASQADKAENAAPRTQAKAETKANPPASPSTGSVNSAGQAEAKPAEPQPVETPGGKPITRDEVQRAMAAKIKAITAQGGGPGVVGELFPKFHGAQCLSDLTEADYPAFLAELSKL